MGLGACHKKIELEGTQIIMIDNISEIAPKHLSSKCTNDVCIVVAREEEDIELKEKYTIFQLSTVDLRIEHTMIKIISIQHFSYYIIYNVHS